MVCHDQKYQRGHDGSLPLVSGEDLELCRAYFLGMDQALLLTGPNGLIRMVNYAYTNLFGWGIERIFRSPVTSVHHIPDLEDLIVDPPRELWLTIDPGMAVRGQRLIGANGDDGLLFEFRPLNRDPDELARSRQAASGLPSLLEILAFKKPETVRLQRRMRRYVEILATELSLPAVEVRRLALACPHHDLGLVGVPESILYRRSTLSMSDWSVVRAHPQFGHALLRESAPFATAAEVALAHHERWDGNGYPMGLTGPQIPLSARICAVADVYDSMRTQRPYRGPESHRKTRTYIESSSGTHFDPTVVQAFLRHSEGFAHVYEAPIQALQPSQLQRGNQDE